MDETDGGHRLPRAVLPTHYDIKITPDLKKFTFDGEVTISVQVRFISCVRPSVCNIQYTFDNEPPFEISFQPS